MSADLFAEFGNPAASADGRSSRATEAQTRKEPSFPDIFGTFSNDGTALGSQNALQWSSSHGGSTGASAWGQPNSGLQSSLHLEQLADAGDDGWGDFEVAEDAAVSATPSMTAFKAAASASAARFCDTPTVDSAKPQPTQDTAQRHNIEPSGKELLNLDYPGRAASPAHLVTLSSPGIERVRVKSITSDPNVLFNADDFELQAGGCDDDDFDDFGDFEAVDPEPQLESKPATEAIPASSPSVDLLGLDDAPPQQPGLAIEKDRKQSAAIPLRFGAVLSTESKSDRQYPQEPPVAPRPVANTPVSNTTVRKSEVNHKSSHPGSEFSLKPSEADSGASVDDEWAAWDDLSTDYGSSAPVTGPGKMATAVDAPDPWKWDSVDTEQSTTAEMDENTPPPTNVPPPAILLSAFPELFDSGNALLRPASGQSTSVRQQILSTPEAINFLRGYLLLAVTAARIMAGRKHRWHRDKILAKGMSISAAGSKGMKLAGIDKTQSAREDREAADVAAHWKEHVGRLRSAVAVVRSAGQATLHIPELSESPQVQTTKFVPTAPKACVICGLKRDERVARVDHDVEDSFGEWWVDHWGHRACKNFWLQHEHQLRQR